MASNNENQKSYAKLAQIYNAFQEDYPKPLYIINNLMKKEGDINCQFPTESYVVPELIGNTALHIAAIKDDEEVSEILLDNGADSTIKNYQGRTALHCALYASEKIEYQKDLIDLLLSRQISSANPNNPCDANGLSHFHIACIYDQIDLVEFFLNTGISIDLTVHHDSERFAGYTPLHLAAEGIALSVIKLLLMRKVNTSIKNTQGLKPIHILFKKKIELLDSDDYLGNTLGKIDVAINMLLDHSGEDDTGLTDFLISCTQRDSSAAKNFLKEDVDVNQRLKLDSPVYPGYTALHLAICCNLDIAIMLLDKKADISVRDANGRTPMDLFWIKRRDECDSLFESDEYDILRFFEENWNDVKFTDKQTSLLDYIKTVREPEIMIQYLEIGQDIFMTIDKEPACFAGWTLLHFAVMLCNSCIISDLCISQGFHALVDVQDSCGSTPIHLAFCMDKLDIVEVLLDHWYGSSNIADNNGLTYLHIACALDKVQHVKRFSPEDKNNYIAYRGKVTYGLITPGSTALHVAIAKGNEEVIKSLLDYGLDLETKDDMGQTPFHRFLQLTGDKVKSIGKILVPFSMTTDSIFEDLGLTRLNMAIYICYESGIQQFITPSNINAVIKCDDKSSFFYPYDGCTPLHLAIMVNGYEVETLLDEGANFLEENYRGDTPLYAALRINRLYSTMKLIIKTLRNDKDLRERLKEKSGITILHIVSYFVKSKAVGWLLIGELDVNAQVNMDCLIWQGYTPLHLLLKKNKDYEINYEYNETLLMLLSAKANVSIEDSNGETPIHFAMKIFTVERIETVVTVLFNHLQVFDVNPVDRNGISHFHVACLFNNVKAVELFLKNGKVDVNQPIDFFNKDFPGQTPLHLALNSNMEKRVNSTNKRQTVDLLLIYGADVNAEDSRGHTPFHEAVKSKDCLYFMERLIEYGASMDVRNIFEQTPLELLLQSKYTSTEAIKIFEKLGCRLNLSNILTEEGFASMLISDRYHPSCITVYKSDGVTIPVTEILKESLDIMINAVDSSLPDDNGRYLLHNIVTTNEPNSDIFKYYFEKIGEDDVDLQDKTGKTALHLAAIFGNFLAVCALLDKGADINILDAKKQTALNYAIKYDKNKKFCQNQCHEKIINYMIPHLQILKRLNLEICKTNVIAERKALEMKNVSSTRKRNYKNEEIDRLKNDIKTLLVDDESKLFLEDFLTDTGKGLTLYSYTSDLRREKIDMFFRNYNGKLNDVCMLQYRKAIKRSKLLNLALDSIWKIVNCNVPTDCTEIIFQYLTNSDLQNFIKATM